MLSGDWVFLMKKIKSNVHIMTIKIENLENGVLVTLDGSLDTDAAMQAEPQLLGIKSADITLDCTAVDYIASSGLRLFLQLVKKARSEGGKITLRGVKPSVMEILVITHFDRMFTIE